MRSTATDRVAGQSLTTVSPVKTAELIEMPFWMWIRVRPRNCTLDGVQILQREGALLRKMTSGFSHATEHHSQWTWRQISPHTVEQHSDWPAAEAVEKFSQWKIPLQCSMSSKFFGHLLLLLKIHWLQWDCLQYSAGTAGEGRWAKFAQGLTKLKCYNCTNLHFYPRLHQHISISFLHY